MINTKTEILQEYFSKKHNIELMSLRKENEIKVPT